MKTKKVYFVFAPIFLHWPVAFVKKIAALENTNVASGGFIGGAKKFHELLVEEMKGHGNPEDFVYTHDLEEKWIFTPYRKEDLIFFQKLLGSQKLNELIIADRHIGNGYLFCGGISASPMLKQLQKDKEAHLNYIVNMLRFLYDFLKDRQPDLLYSYAVAGAFTLAIAELCDKLNITFAKLTHTRILNKVVVDYGPRDDMKRVEQAFLNAEDISNEVKDWAAQHLLDFRVKQKQPDYQINQNKVYQEKTTWKHQAKLLVKRMKGTVDKSNNFFHNSYNDIVKYEQSVFKGIKKYWKEKPYFTKAEIPDKQFLFYPLHVDPEASTMVLSPYQTNQLSVLEALSKSKPVDAVILVKEHLTMIGRRPKDFYKKVNQLPGIYMVDPREPSFQFINKAKAVVTLTGTAGFEAILLGKPAIFLGNFLYKFIKEGFVLTNDLSALPEILNNLDQLKPANDETLVKLLASIDQESIPFDGGLIWKGVSKERVVENPDVVELFAREFIKII